MTRIDINPALAAFLRPHAERTAEPIPDREPEKRGVPPLPDPIPEPTPRLDLAQWSPAAVETWRAVERIPEERAGVLAPKAFVGMQPDGTKAEGASSWEWRPPLPMPVRGHDEMPLQANGIASGYQPAPPVHVPGAVYGSPRDMRRAVRLLSESQAERLLLAQSLDGVSVDALGYSPQRVARERMKRRGK